MLRLCPHLYGFLIYPVGCDEVSMEDIGSAQAGGKHTARIHILGWDEFRSLAGVCQRLLQISPEGSKGGGYREKLAGDLAVFTAGFSHRLFELVERLFSLMQTARGLIQLTSTNERPCLVEAQVRM